MFYFRTHQHVYSPSALQESANLVGTAKAHGNPENTVGIMSLAGRNPELLLSPTDDMGKIMTSIHDVKMSGHLSFADGVQIAYLALKHRRNKNGGPRLVVFVGSPVMDESKKLTTLAKMLNKNNVSLGTIFSCYLVRRISLLNAKILPSLCRLQWML